jgi:hypothetical protein
MTARRLRLRSPALFFLGALCVGMWSYAWASSPLEKVQTASCGTTAQAIEGSTGRHATLLCPAGCGGQALWGTEIYTDDSSLCAAAIHAGELGPEGGRVAVEIRPGEPKYAGSRWHGVRSNSWGSWRRSLEVVEGSGVSARRLPPIRRTLACTETAAGFGAPGTVHRVECEPGCEQTVVWGSQSYTSDSSICGAARHAGVIGKSGGAFEVVIAAGRSSYSASKRNGVRTRAWGAWDSSFWVRP